MNIGERIKELRKALGLNQTEFGKIIGLATNTIANYEIGRRNVSEQTIKSICREFNVNILWLKNGEGNMLLPKAKDILLELKAQYNMSNIEFEMLQKYFKLSDNERNNFAILAKKMFT